MDSLESPSNEPHLTPSSSSHKLKKTILSSIFGLRATKAGKRKHSMDPETVAASNPDLCLSLQYELENFYITVLVVGGLILPFMLFLILFFIRLIFAWTVNYGKDIVVIILLALMLMVLL